MYFRTRAFSAVAALALCIGSGTLAAAEVKPVINRVAATVNLTSANALPWDIETDSGYVGDGGEDAFDSYGGLRLNVRDSAETVLQAGVNVGSLALVSSGTNRLTTSTPFVAAGVSVARDLWAIPGTNVLRYIDSFTNTTGSVRKVRVVFGAVHGDLGSDDETRVAGTSSGDRVITTADNWMVSIEGAADYTSPAGDPPVGLAWSNRAAAAFISSGNAGDPLVTAFPGDEDDGFSPVYELTINPGATVRLMHFLYRGLSESGAPQPERIAAGEERNLAISVTSALVTTPTVSDLSPAERASIFNWSFAVAAEAVPVPATSPLPLLAAMLLLAGFSSVILRGRNRSHRNH